MLFVSTLCRASSRTDSSAVSLGAANGCSFFCLLIVVLGATYSACAAAVASAATAAFFSFMRLLNALLVICNTKFIVVLAASTCELELYFMDSMHPDMCIWGEGRMGSWGGQWNPPIAAQWSTLLPLSLAPPSLGARLGRKLV